MKISPIKITNTYSKSVAKNQNKNVQSSKNVSFSGFYLRKEIADYTVYAQSRLSLATRIYREPFLWKALPEYAEKRFANQDKVKIIQGACSVGLETRGIESEFVEQLGDRYFDKYHLIASDPDFGSVALAKTNLMCFSSKDKDITWHKAAGIPDFTKHFRPLEGNEKLQKLYEYFILMKENKIRNIEFDKNLCAIIQKEPTAHDKSFSTRIIDLVYEAKNSLSQNTDYRDISSNY